jgi:2-oxo-4-hydroxy-4-carboxy-5-ureidoimidazoline decarboxylase
MSDPDKACSRAAFVERFGGVYEHSPWVAEQCFAAAEKLPQSEYADLFARCVDAADHASKFLLIQAHPDLAGRAAVRGELTVASTDEQASAGIDQCSDKEYARFIAFNAAYKEKFGFPFIMAVKKSNRHEILAAFSKRIENDADTEFETAMREIHKIARLRLEAMSEDGW